MKKTLKTGFIVAFIVLCSFFAISSKEFYLKQFTFNDNKALNKWGRMVLNGESEYRLMKRGNDGYVRAHSDKACSAIYYRIGFNAKNYPFLSWKWRVLKFPDISMARTPKEKDDYAARVYIIFPFLNFSSSRFIEYVWAQDIPVGKVIDSPAGSNVKIIVARSGKTAENEWAFERRNVYNDYIKAFGRKPNRSAGAIAIMCDSDSTKSSAESDFDDIVIESEVKLAERSEKK